MVCFKNNEILKNFELHIDKMQCFNFCMILENSTALSKLYRA